MPISLDDVAQTSGVSAATVSRVLNHPAKVRPAVRARVERVMADLNYVPHGVARSLASNQTRTMGAIVPMFDISLFARIVEGVQQTMHENGYTLLLAKCNYDPDREASEVRALVERGIDGLILVGTSRNDEVYQLLRSRRVPFVNTCTYASDAPWPCVGWDNRLAAMRMARYLIDLGHKRFAIISSPTKNNDRASERLKGYVAALREADITIDDRAIIESEHTIAEARVAMSRLLLLPERPTAVICGTDTLAYGALQECVWSGASVPNDISITGFDDIEIAAHCVPALTTLRVPAHDVGRQAALLVLAAQQYGGRINSVRFDLELIVRGTTQRFAPQNEGRTPVYPSSETMVQ